MKQIFSGTKPFSAFGKTSGNRHSISINFKETTGRKGPSQGTVMIKAISAIAIAAFIAAALSILPGFAPQVEASVPVPLAKGDRLDIHPVGRNCSQQAWPNFEASCLRAAGSKTLIRQARLVSADRTR
jgi:hypothetical protein